MASEVKKGIKTLCIRLPNIHDAQIWVITLQLEELIIMSYIVKSKITTT